MDADPMCSAADRFAARQFGHVQLGDQRRTRRLVQVAAAFARGGGGDNGGTITSVMRNWAQAKAAYRLMDRPEVTHEAVLAGHSQQTLAATAMPGAYLLIEDSTAVSYPDPQGTRGMGPIGEDYTRGLWVHSTLAMKVDWDNKQRQLLGLLGQKTWVRSTHRSKRGKESDHARQSRPNRESQRWAKHLQNADGPINGTTSWTYVADRESDIYEVLLNAFVNNWTYVIRAAHRRALVAEQSAEDLFTAAAKGTLHGHVELKWPRQRRPAKLTIGSRTLQLRGPKRPGGHLINLTVNVVWARQIDPPKGQTPLHWVLLTDWPADNLAQCQRVLDIYASRWLIEEWHKALKTGLKVESSQLSDARRLATLVGILSVVAIFLVQQKLAAQNNPQAPVDPQSINPAILAVLRKTNPPPHGHLTQHWLWFSIAKLGGFMARKSDGNPGWLTLWRGWQTLMILVKGYQLANTS